MSFWGCRSSAVKLPTGSARFLSNLKFLMKLWIGSVLFLMLASRFRRWGWILRHAFDELRRLCICFRHFEFWSFCGNRWLDFSSPFEVAVEGTNFGILGVLSFIGILRNELLSMFLIRREERTKEDREQQEGGLAYVTPKRCCWVWTWRPTGGATNTWDASAAATRTTAAW